jgi:branched-chain amino acid transport system substrate-binding protein
MNLKIAFLTLVACIASGGAASKEILVGQVAPILDPLVAGYQMKSGVELYFDAVNRAGGIHNASLRLVAKDRSMVVSDAVPKTRELIEQYQPIALIALQGTAPMDALVKEGVLDKAELPVVGIRTGATSLHQPVNPWLFHTRASYAVEAEKIVNHLKTIGFKKIAIFHENTAFGKEAARHTEAAMKKVGLKPVAVASYELNTNEVKPALATLRAASPDAIIAASVSSAAAELYKGLNQNGSQRVQLLAFSTVDAATVVKLIGRVDARGLGIAQVVPDPANRRTSVVREFQDNVRKYRDPGFELTQGALEGYIAAKVLVEALRGAGPNPTPAKLKQSLERLGSFDAGGFSIAFSPKNHSGSTYVNIGILASDGKMMQ